MAAVDPDRLAQAPRGTLGTVRNATLLLDLLSEGSPYQQLTDLAEQSSFRPRKERGSARACGPRVDSGLQLPSPNSSQVPLIGFCFTPRREKSQTRSEERRVG